MAVEIHQSIFAELADFIILQPSLQDVIDYKVPEPLDDHIEALLEKNRESTLTPDERKEMEHFLAMSRLMTQAKAKAHNKLIRQR